MPAVPLNVFFQWNANYNYTKWDVVTVQYPGLLQYFYAVKDSYGASPSAPLGPTCFVPTSSTRQDNVVRISFTQTGTESFQQGSIIAVADISPDSSVNYTGVCLAGGSGWADYLNPGLNVTNGISGGSVQAPCHPYWTTGFAWLPSWQTKATSNVAVVEAKLGEGYSSRMNPVINSNSLSWNLVFAERTNKETMALLTFLQVAGGATPFYINFPVGNLFNQANLKYVAQAPDTPLTSYGLNQTNVIISQVFDIGQ